MPRPRVYDDHLRARLITTAAAAIAESGVTGLSLRAVAAAEDTSTNAVYTLFGGKAGLVEAVVEEAAAGFTGAQRAVTPTPDAMADLLALGYAYRTWVLAHPAMYAVLMGGRAPAPRLAGGVWTSDPTAQPLLAGVRRALAEGLLVAEDPEQVAITLWAGVHGMVTLEVALWGDLPEAERERRFAEHVWSLACRWVPA